MIKPPVKINSLKDLKIYLNFNIEGSYGYWIDRSGIINVVVPRANYTSIRDDIKHRIPNAADIYVRKQSIVTELILLWERLKGWVHYYG